ncbi:acyl-CoA synthetase [Phyllobacterium sp. YR531]|uniref:acyl-CoA synthetase n=1 Tax=Phyllobacterium sp. YR531 TaxID=1144343 RepID=UPI00026F8FF3|nr:acyl-CoA synthetase [Phyllobacterium sp. YR531]EJN03624.1 acyl-CoA synthetase (AMP-forming)/AMP-acid ligase II [Phyllobacterium sp. YR531]
MTQAAGLSIVPMTRRVMNLANFLHETALRYSNEIGFVWADKTWTWAQIDRRVNAMAAALQIKFGVTKGDRILIQSQNCNQMFESMFACFKLGAIWVPANFRQTPDEVAYLAMASGAKGMICGSAFPDHAAACLAASESLEFTISIGTSQFGDEYDMLVDEFSGQVTPLVSVNHDDPCWFFFTSGTTGRPKAAILTHGQMAFVITNHLCDLMPGTTQTDASLVVAPLSHGAGIHQLTQVARGAKTILLPTEKFDAAEAWRLVEKWQVSNMFTVPTILKILTEHPSVSTHDHSSLRYVIYAGAPMYRTDQIHALKTLGSVIVQYFGLGEVTGNITVLPPECHSSEDHSNLKVGTCGYARTGMQISIQEETGKELAPGETGEICVIGPAVFAGYYNNPEANEKAFRNGWFRTGDLGHLDNEGFLFITGRASDMYISGGSNVYPREIEEKILTHPDISEVAVIGIPDPVWGEVGLAVCVARSGAKPDSTAIIEWLGNKMARYKLPKRFVFWPEMPKSAYGKIAKKLIRDELIRRKELDA